MVINFQKMHGTMNDFVVFPDKNGMVELTAQEVVRVCDRRSGVGSDGIIIVRPSACADFFMDYINSNGSLAEMCGNGIRCLAKYVYDEGLTDKEKLSVETRAGVKMLELFPGPDGKIVRVKVNMGRPVFDPEHIPTRIHTLRIPIIDYPIEVQGVTFLASIVSMGNPHCVIFLEGDIESFPSRYGPSLENHSVFPSRTNVEFVKPIAPDKLLMRVWERGSGETLSCGTGACAAAVAASLKGLVDHTLTVQLLGGDLEIDWKGENASVFMTGPAATVYNGTITI